MSIIEAIILGIIQGLTEFLPVSSSGHIELGSHILNVESSENLLFTVMVHCATALSTIVVFRKDIIDIFTGIFKREAEALNYSGKLILSMIPVGLVGVFFKDYVEGFFGGDILLVGFMLVITALLLALTHYAKTQTGEVTYGKAFLIGVAQAIAILPGISRSGSTIASALLMNVKKENAARFSFLMVLVPIIGASLLELKDYFEDPSLSEGIGGLTLAVGFIAAFVSGLIACQWMINIVKRGKLIYFAIYCLVVGIIAIATSF